MKITYSSDFLYQKNGVAHGIAEDTLKKNEARLQQIKDSVSDQIFQKKFGFISTVFNGEEAKITTDLFHQLRWAKNLVVIGIGGSDLGARALQQALEVEEPPMSVYFHGDSTDPVSITRLMRTIDVEETIFCIISKSGETIETISQYVFLKKVVKKQTEEWAEHFIFITDAQKGILREEADANDILTLPIPNDVGGRFSVQTTVGLLPAIAMGVNIEQLLKGFQTATTEYVDLAWQIARDQYVLSQQGMHISVLMPYSVQLAEFARWYRQLWAESLGKDGKGILPIQAHGPADQHSQLQFYADGQLLQSLLFLRVEQRPDNYVIEDVDIESVKYLEGHSFHEILNVEHTATALALKKVGRPSASLAINELNEESMGALLMIFEMAVVFLGEMFEIDPFNQPGVEESKQMMYALLDREGYEAKKKEIEELKEK